MEMNKTPRLQNSPQSTMAAPLEDFLRPLEQIGGALHAVAHPHPAPEPSLPGPTRSLPITAESVSAAIEESLAMLRQLKDTVSKVTGEVQDGSLQRLSEQLSRRQGIRKRPYSMLLAQPHLKINAAMGCLARMPLPPLGALSPRRQVPPLTSMHNRSTSASSLASRASLSSQLAEAWEPYLK